MILAVKDPTKNNTRRPYMRKYGIFRLMVLKAMYLKAVLYGFQYYKIISEF